MPPKTPVCVLCNKDLLESSDTISAVVCGHIFHQECIGSWNEFSDYCPVCKKFLGEDFPYDIKLLYKEPGHKQTYEAIDQLLQKNKDCQRRIESSEGLLSKIKILHEIHEELEYFFTGQKNDDD